MLARVNGGHLDARVDKGKVFQGHGFVFVVADDVLHHKVRGKRGGALGGGGVAREVEAGSSVVRRVGYVEGLCAEGSELEMNVSELGEGEMARLFLTSMPLHQHRCHG